LRSTRSHQGTTATSAWPPDLVEQEKGEDSLSFRPEWDFVGEQGRYQFFIVKEGAIADRHVLSLPGAEGGRC